jgi:hypothetical protein
MLFQNWRSMVGFLLPFFNLHCVLMFIELWWYCSRTIDCGLFLCHCFSLISNELRGLILLDIFLTRSIYECLNLFLNNNNKKKIVVGMPIDLLLSAVVRVAASASCYKYLSPSMHVLDIKSIDGSITAISKLLCHLPMDFSLSNHEIPTRFAATTSLTTQCRNCLLSFCLRHGN